MHACVSAAGGTTSESDSELRIHKRSPGARFSEWLGHWKPEYDDMDQNELMLQVLASPADAAPRCCIKSHNAVLAKPELSFGRLNSDGILTC